MALGNAKRIAEINEFQQPFPVSSVALIAAEAALKDTAFLRATKQFIASERSFLTKALTKRGFQVSQSITNNLFVSRADNQKIILALAAKDVSVIDGTFFPDNKLVGFRISLRDKKTNRTFLARLDEALACLTPNKLLRS
jgi:histidinol-phosphate aminotransferase